jgi:hypothetical protein
MGMNAPHDQQRAPQPDIFWRRRVIALAAGIAILGLLAWAVSGVVGGGNAARQGAGAGQASKSAAPAAPSGTPSSAPASAQATPSPSPSPTPTHKTVPHKTVPHKTVTTAHTGSGCPAADVVISLSAAEYSYSARMLPEFEVAIVSTAARPCTFDVGTKSLQLVIKSGPARVWGSADCTADPGSHSTALARGVPTLLHISWDRKTSVPGCRLAPTVAGPGTYTATANSGQLTSNTLIFVLRGAGLAVP